MRSAAPILLSSEERSVLETWAKWRKVPLRLVQRAQLIQMAADGVQNRDIARELGILQAHGAAVAGAHPGLAAGGSGEGCSTTRPYPEHFREENPCGYRSHAPYETGERDPLEHAQHGEGTGPQPSHHPPHLE